MQSLSAFPISEQCPGRSTSAISFAASSGYCRKHNFWRASGCSAMNLTSSRNGEAQSAPISSRPLSIKPPQSVLECPGTRCGWRLRLDFLKLALGIAPGPEEPLTASEKAELPEPNGGFQSIWK